MPPPPIIGLVGGVASGKSAVAALLAEQGAMILDADKLAHEALEQADVRQELVDRWGKAILDGNGRVDRTAVAGRVFGQSETATSELRFLEGVLHPRIRRRVESAIAVAGDAGAKAAVPVAVPAVVIDAPLLLEAGWGDLCDEIWFVDAPTETRRQRSAGRGWTIEDFARREAAQMPISEKRAASTHVIPNWGDVALLRTEIDQQWNRVTASQADADSTAPN